MRASLLCPSRSVNVDGEDPTPLQDAVLALLEDAGLPESFNDRIVRLLELAEQRQANKEKTSDKLDLALSAVFPYAAPSDDPDTGRADAQRIILKELGLKAR